jgi:hypothetical protein
MNETSTLPTPIHRGKVRDIYDLDDHLLLVAPRISGHVRLNCSRSRLHLPSLPTDWRFESCKRCMNSKSREKCAPEPQNLSENY